MLVKLTGLSRIAERYEVFVFDQFGVIHDGVNLCPGALEALENLKEGGRKIGMISNSGKRAGTNLQRMGDMFGLPPDFFDFAITSGEAFRIKYQAPHSELSSLGGRVLFISRGKDKSILEGLDLEEAPVESADFVLLAGMNSPDTPYEDYSRLMEKALKRNLPAVCVNPDKLMIVGDARYPTCGMLAEEYRNKGGTVFWVGKPHSMIFDVILERFPEIPLDSMLMIGDSMEHDIAGANNVGMDSLLILEGLLKDTLDFRSSESEIKNRLSKYPVLPKFLMQNLCW